MNMLFGVNKSIGEAAASLMSGLLDGLGIKKNEQKISNKYFKQLTHKKSVYCSKGHQAVRRTNKLTNEDFWGCSKFPECRWTKKIK